MEDLIYIIEDEENIREILRCCLTNDGYKVKLFENGGDAFLDIEKNKPALILLDLMLPVMDGITILKFLKSSSMTMNIPVIIITAKSEEVDKVVGLDTGADDYITKPFGILELLARVRACIRKSQNIHIISRISIGDIILDSDTRQVEKLGEIVRLTLKEFKLLELLMKNYNKVLSREEIISSIWGYDFVGETRTLDMHVKTLRTKLGDNVDSPKFIGTIRGVGYKFIGG